MQKNIRRYWPIFVLPTLAAFLLGFVIPFIQGLYLSLCKFTTINKTTFVGFTNYVKAFQDEQFLHAFGFTASFTVVSTLLINVVALGIALLLTRGIKGTTPFRTVFFMPNLIGGIVLGYIWQILLNCVLSLLGKPLLSLDANAGYWGMIILMCWQQIGYMMIIYIAGLQSIPNDYIEAAYIDGATSWQTFWRFKLFDQNLALTAGEPAHATEMLAMNIYQTFYVRSGPMWKGIGQAKAVIFCILVIAISSLQLKFTRSKEVQQ